MKFTSNNYYSIYLQILLFESFVLQILTKNIAKPMEKAWENQLCLDNNFRPKGMVKKYGHFNSEKQNCPVARQKGVVTCEIGGRLGNLIFAYANIQAFAAKYGLLPYGPGNS